MTTYKSILSAFISGWRYAACNKRKHCNTRDKLMREYLKDHQIDSMIESSFPASDPPSTY
jgi:hypothetical protein